MAIIDAIPGLKAEVIVNNTPLQEYPDPDTSIDPKKTTTYIEAQSGCTFHVLVKFFDNFPAAYGVRLETRLDGKKFTSQIFRTEILKRPEGHKSNAAMSNIRGRWHQSAMLFSPLTVGKYPPSLTTRLMYLRPAN
jgi:hypothetical protein